MSRVHSTFTTKGGTRLDLLDLRGKPYLQVAHRLVWFTEENPCYAIDTEFPVMDVEEGLATAKVIITILTEEGKMIRRAMATKSETKKSFSDYVEKAETGAIGRALAMLGYGTQFTGDELDEGERLADSPISPAKKKNTTGGLRGRSTKSKSADTTTATGTSPNQAPTSNSVDIDL
jgi:hypothetical protein